MIYSPEKSTILTDKIGDNVTIHTHTWIGRDVVIGNNVKIQAMAFIPDGVTLEDDVFIAPSVTFTNDTMPPSHGKFWARTLVKKGAVIGANSTVLPGVTIGENSLVGAGSVITKDIPANQIWCGNPAKFMREKWNWCVMGDKGFVAPRHIKAIEEIGDKVLMTCDVEKDWEEMIKTEEWKEINAVAICTPNYLHYPMSFAMKDKVIVCEKPLTLSSKSCELLGDNVNAILQLRNHPAVIKAKEELTEGKHSGTLTVKVKRDQHYWEIWKGKDEQSGGILFNLGIHYFDLLIYLFGNEYKVLNAEYAERKATGEIDFNGSIFKYHIEIMPDDNGQTRQLEVDGQEIVLSKQDNLSFEDLHTAVYKDVKNGKGIKPSEAIKAIKLVEKLKYGA